MAHHITLFQFRLSNGQSIGPAVLRRLWSQACSSDDVTVSRHSRPFDAQGHTYSLCGPARTANLAGIEERLRRLLDKRAIGATTTLVRLF